MSPRRRSSLAGLAALAALAGPAVLGAQGQPARTVSREQAGTVAASAPAPAPAPVTARRTAGAPRAPKADPVPTEVTIEREVFAYARDGRRDPYASLMNTSELRPLLSDLRLTAVLQDMANAQGSVAILRDVNSDVQYRVRVGQQLGRLRVAAISQKAVQFTIEEFGYNRQESLPLASDSTKVRKP